MKIKYLPDTKKKVLTLTVSKKWFDMIVAGEKTEEYREIKPYWVARFYYDRFGKLSPKMTQELTDSIIEHGGIERFESNNSIEVYCVPYTHVRFFYGYAKNRPRIEKEIESITIGKPKKGMCPNEWLHIKFFIIKFK